MIDAEYSLLSREREKNRTTIERVPKRIRVCVAVNLIRGFVRITIRVYIYINDVASFVVDSIVSHAV